MSKALNLKVIVLLIIVMLCQSCKKHSESQPNHNWQTIFNGKNLNGWTPKIKGQVFGNDSLKTFRVEKGTLKVSYQNYDSFDNRFGHLFYKTQYSNYRLKLQYRFVGKQVAGSQSWAEKNSGIMIHCQAPESISLNQNFPNSLEVQLLGGVIDSIPRPTGNLCTPGTHVHIDGKQIIEHCITSDAPTYYGNEWIKAEVEVYSDSLIRHYINGKPVITYNKPVIDKPDDSTIHLKPVKFGYISLQSESHPIEFRDIKLMEL